MFQRLIVGPWRQFARIDVSFSARLTVLTGPNGCGKTTILGNHFNWRNRVIGTPKLSADGGLYYSTDAPDDGRIGSILYASGEESDLSAVIQERSNHYEVRFQGTNHEQGLYIPSPRAVPEYVPVVRPLADPHDASQAYVNYNNAYRARFLSERERGTTGASSAHFVMKEYLISFARSSNTAHQKLFSDFQQVVRNVLPAEIRFSHFEPRMSDLAVVTETGDFSIDAISGGLVNILDMAWQIFLFGQSIDDMSFVAVIDEPENNLHPGMQQRIMPNLLTAFPSVQFVVATHSPLVVTSVEDSEVYALRIGTEDGKVRSERLEFREKAATANETLRKVLDLPFTIPLWADERLQFIIEKYANLEPDPGVLERMRDELSQSGLDQYSPRSAAEILLKRFRRHRKDSH